MKFYERLKELRNKKGVSQAFLANKLNVTPGAVAHWELGNRNPDYNTLIKIADYFEVDVNYLIGQRDISHRQPVDENELKLAKDYFFNKLGFRSDDDLIESINDQSLISLFKEVIKYPNLTKEEISVHLYGDYMNQETGEIITRKDLVKNKLKLFNDPVSAGFGTWLDEGCEYSFIDIDNDYVNADFALKVKGDSMVSSIQ